MRQVITAAIILVSLASNAKAEELFVMGVGATSCAEFGQRYKENPSKYDLVYFSWGQGWMSGINMALGYKAGVAAATNLADIRTEDQMGLIRIFCSDNPLKHYLDAVESLFNTLRNKQGLPSWASTLKGK